MKESAVIAVMGAIVASAVLALAAHFDSWFIGYVAGCLVWITYASVKRKQQEERNDDRL